MDLLSCFLASKKKTKPSSNISMCVRGYGHYKESDFEIAIYGKCVEQDWWIESEAYMKLLSDLGLTLTRSQASALIAQVPKDMPVNPGVRFPCRLSTPGMDDYAPLRFVRVQPNLRKCLQMLVGCQLDATFINLLAAIVSITVPSYNRDSFESTFGLVWTDAKG